MHRIRPDPKQPRRNLDTQKQWELTASIERHGIIQPITVQFLDAENIYQIITGERRYQAAMSLGLPAIPSWVRTPKYEEVLVHQIIENWQRADLHPFDLADTLVRLRDEQHYSQKAIAELTGKPESEISKLLSLLKLREPIQQQYRRDKTGLLSRRHLENIAKLPADQQEAFHAQIADQKLTANETAKIVQQKLEDRRGERRPGAPVGVKKRFVTPKATVVLSFRRKNIVLGDVLEALDDAKRQAGEENSES